MMRQTRQHDGIPFIDDDSDQDDADHDDAKHYKPGKAT